MLNLLLHQIFWNFQYFMSFLYCIAEKLLVLWGSMLDIGIQFFQHHFGLLLLPEVILAQKLLDLLAVREFGLGCGPLILVLSVLVIIFFARLSLDMQLLHIFEVLPGLDADSHGGLIGLRIINNLDKWKLFLNLGGLLFVVHHIGVIAFKDIRCLNIHHFWTTFPIWLWILLLCAVVHFLIMPWIEEWCFTFVVWHHWFLSFCVASLECALNRTFRKVRILDLIVWYASCISELFSDLFEIEFILLPSEICSVFIWAIVPGCQFFIEFAKSGLVGHIVILSSRGRSLFVSACFQDGVFLKDLDGWITFQWEFTL